MQQLGGNALPTFSMLGNRLNQNVVCGGGGDDGKQLKQLEVLNSL